MWIFIDIHESVKDRWTDPWTNWLSYRDDGMHIMSLVDLDSWMSSFFSFFIEKVAIYSSAFIPIAIYSLAIYSRRHLFRHHLFLAVYSGDIYSSLFNGSASSSFFPFYRKISGSAWRWPSWQRCIWIVPSGSTPWIPSLALQILQTEPG